MKKISIHFVFLFVVFCCCMTTIQADDLKEIVEVDALAKVGAVSSVREYDPQEVAEGLEIIGKKLAIATPSDLALDEQVEYVFEVVSQAVVEGKDVESINKLGSSLDVLRNKQGDSILASFVRKNDVMALKKVVENKQAGLLLAGSSLDEALLGHIAVYEECDLNILSTLFSGGLATITQTTPEGVSLVHVAIERGRSDIVEHFINKGVNLNVEFKIYSSSGDFINLSPLAYAVMRGQLDNIDALMKKKAVNIKSVKMIGNLLHLAVYFDRYESLKHLLNNYFDRVQNFIEEPNGFDLTPLMSAAALDRRDAIRILHDYGASLQSTNGLGRTVMHIASEYRQKNSIKLLAYLGAHSSSDWGSLFSMDDDRGKRPFDLVVGKDDFDSATTANLLLNLSRSDRQEAKSPPKFDKYLPRNLVFRGGGPKGLAYIGAIEVLEQTGTLEEVKRIAGTSAGAITAALLAVGYTSDQMKTTLLENPINELLEHPETIDLIKETIENMEEIKATVTDGAKKVEKIYKANWGLLGKGVKYLRTDLSDQKKLFNKLKPLLEFLPDKGICDGNIFRDWFDKLIEDKTGIKDCTFGELAELIKRGGKFKHLHVFGSKITDDQEIVNFNSEDASCKNLIISDAVAISISIPAVFKPRRLYYKNNDDRDPGGRDFFVDGGIIYNFPVEAFDQRQFIYHRLEDEELDFPVFNRRTLGLSLYSSSVEDEKERLADDISIQDIVKGVAGFFLKAENLIRQRNTYNRHRVIEIDSKDVGTLDFQLSEDAQNILIESGKEAVRQFLHQEEERALYILELPDEDEEMEDGVE